MGNVGYQYGSRASRKKKLDRTDIPIGFTLKKISKGRSELHQGFFEYMHRHNVHRRKPMLYSTPSDGIMSIDDVGRGYRSQESQEALWGQTNVQEKSQTCQCGRKSRCSEGRATRLRQVEESGTRHVTDRPFFRATSSDSLNPPKLFK